MNRLATRGLLFGLLLAFGQGARADLTAMPLEALLSSEIITASRFPQQAREAPAAVTVISARDIQEHGWRVLGDALMSVRGTVVANDRAYSYLGPRGLLRPLDYNTHVLLMVDGARINDNIYHQSPIGMEFPLDLELVERIEFVPGPGSSIYGNNAFLGVVNIITRSGARLDGTEAGVDIGSYGQRRVRISHGGAAHGQDWLLSLSHSQRDGADFSFPELAAYNGGMAENLDGETDTRAYARLNSGDLSLTAFWSRRQKANPSAPYYGLVGDPRADLEDRHGHLGLSYDWQLAPNLAMNLLADYGDYRFHNDLPGDRSVANDSDLYRDSAVGRWINLQARVTDSRGEDHKWVYGMEWLQDLERSQKGVDLTTGEVYADVAARGQQLSLYAQDEWRLRPGWLLNIGARYDHHSSFGGALSPRLALIQQVGPRTTLKYLAGSAYRAPNAFESSYDDGISANPTQYANPNLGPERIHTLEFVAEHETAEHWLLTGVLFQYRIKNLIGFDDTLSMYVNQGTVNSSGAAIEAERRWQSGSRLKLSLEQQHARDMDGRVSHSPEWTAKLLASVPLGTWRLGIEGYHVGARLTTDGSEIKAYNIAHLNLVAPRFKSGGEFSLRIANLFDTTYHDPAGYQHEQTRIPQDGRTLEARFNWRF
jgi:iron complex outermembrane receptor protein